MPANTGLSSPISNLAPSAGSKPRKSAVCDVDPEHDDALREHSLLHISDHIHLDKANDSAYGEEHVDDQAAVRCLSRIKRNRIDEFCVRAVT